MQVRKIHKIKYYDTKLDLFLLLRYEVATKDPISKRPNFKNVQFLKGSFFKSSNFQKVQLSKDPIIKRSNYQKVQLFLKIGPFVATPSSVIALCLIFLPFLFIAL